MAPSLGILEHQLRYGTVIKWSRPVVQPDPLD